MSCTKVSMFRRFLFLVCMILSIPLIVISVMSIVVTLPFLALKWLFTGCADEDLIFKPMEYFVNLPYKIIE